MVMESTGIIPKRQTVGSCGYDFYAPEDIVLTPGEWTTVDTGVRFTDKDKTLFKDWFMMVVPRSGLGSKYGFRFRNTAGIIDKDYRDTIKATMTADTPLTIKKGERFMQGIVMPYLFFFDEEVPTAERNGGHGSTGAN